MSTADSERLKALIAHFGVSDRSFIDQALTNQRMMVTKFLTLGPVEPARCHLCLDITLLQIRTAMIDRKALIAHAGVNEKVYEHKLKVCKMALGITDKSALIDTLTSRIGGNITRAAAYKLLHAYNREYVQKLPPASRAAIDIDGAVYHAAAYWLTAQRQKLSIAKAEVQGKAGVPRDMFDDICSVMKRFEGAAVVETLQAEVQGGTQTEKVPSAELVPPVPTPVALKGPIAGLNRAGVGAGARVGHTYAGSHSGRMGGVMGLPRPSSNENVPNGSTAPPRSAIPTPTEATARAISGSSTAPTGSVITGGSVNTKVAAMGRMGLISRALSSGMSAPHRSVPDAATQAMDRDSQLAACERGRVQAQEREAYLLFKQSVLQRHAASRRDVGGDSEEEADLEVEGLGFESGSPVSGQKRKLAVA
jgi:hypothetical protein